MHHVCHLSQHAECYRKGGATQQYKQIKHYVFPSLCLHCTQSALLLCNNYSCTQLAEPSELLSGFSVTGSLGETTRRSRSNVGYP